MNFITIDVNSTSKPYVHPLIHITSKQHKERRIRNEEFTVKTRKHQLKQFFNVNEIDDLTIDDHLQLFNSVLGFLGFNFLDKNYFESKFVVLGIFNVCHLIHYMVMSLVFIKMNIANVDVVSESSATFLLAILLFEKVLNLLFYRKDFNNLIARMRYDYYTAMAKGGFEKDIMYNKILEARMVTRCMYYSCILCVAMFTAFPLYKHKDHLLPFPQTLWYASEDTDRDYYINLAFQIYSMLYALNLLIPHEAFAIFILLNLCGQLNILQYKIKRFGDGEEFYNSSEMTEETTDLSVMNTEHSVKYINHCIQFQQRVYTLAGDMNKTYKYNLLSTLIFSGLVGCVSLYQVSVKSGAQAIPYYLYLGIDVLRLFIFCFYGNLLNIYSMEIPIALYDTQWYRAPAPVKELLKIMLARSQKPINLSGVFANLTLKSFSEVMRSMYSFYALLVQME